ncbi:MAG: TonB-dependent receptor [Tannerella sp.]|jgi:TonB-linked SusC/RagA family outer membrane protein|nr:TonB-dependent receptor [Tannerella sp.]
MYTLALFGQGNIRISGTISDTDGLPLPGVNISVKGTTTGIVSNEDGKYTIQAPGSTAVLVFSYIGYTTQEIRAGNQAVLNVVMQESSQALEEVVVVGYGTQKKVNLSGAVSTISAKTLANRPVTNANLALQGLAPGMNIQMSDSYALNAPGINIRGFTSINGGDAFILVDNVPVTASELSRINPADIESATVLKDAASAAIYGARAAFGVVLITTKTARSEKLTVEANVNYGFRSFLNFPEMSDDIYEFMKIQSIFANDPARFSDEEKAYAKRRMEDPSLPATLHPDQALNPSNRASGKWEYYAVSKWADILMNSSSPVQTYDMRVAQKTEKLSYAISSGYYRQDGMMKTLNDVLTRYNFRGNANYKLTRWWDVGSNITFGRRVFDCATLLDDSWNYYRVIQTYPNVPVYTPEGYYADSWVGYLHEGGTTKRNLNETQVSFNTTVNLIDDMWSVKADANFKFTDDRRDTQQKSYTTSSGPGQTSISGNPYASLSNAFERYTVFNIYTDFHRTFAQKHFLMAMAGFNQEYFRSESSSISADNLLTNSLLTIQLTSPSSTVNKSHGINTLALRGVFARLNYIYDSKYILELNGRRDGTSRYQKSDRFGFFPSASLAWTLSNESFMKSLNDALRISNLKLRGSYGVLGNQNIDNVYYPYIATMGVTSAIGPLIDNAQPLAITQPGVVSGDLTWETVRTINGGIDLGLLNGKFDLSFDRFVRYTEDMMTKSKTLPAIFGAGEPRTNAADLKTNGWEVSAGWRDQFALAGSPFNYSARLMISDSRTFITRYDNPDKVLSDYYEGQEIGEIWGYETLGYFASDAEAAGWADQSAVGNGRPFLAGDLKFKDKNSDGFINQGSNTVDDPGDRRIIGNNRNRLPYSLDLNADWKGFDLRIFLQGVGKRDAYPSESHNGEFFWGQYNTPWGGMIEKNLDNWDYKGDAGYFPRMKPDIANNGELAKVQTKYLQDASFMRVKNLTVGYTLPEQLTGKWRIDRLRVYFSGENIFTFHHMEVPGNDPERNDNVYYPFMKVVSFGLNIGF